MSTPPTRPAAESAVVSGVRTLLGLAGIITLVVGILILVWPGHAAAVVAAIVAIYAIAVGLVYLGLGLFATALGGWARVGHAVLGLVFIAAGVVALANLRAAAATLAVFLAVLVGIMWIVEGVFSLVTVGRAASKTWTVIFAVISIIAGLVLVFSPLATAVFLWWLLGIGLVVLGLVQIVRAFTLRATVA